MHLLSILKSRCLRFQLVFLLVLIIGTGVGGGSSPEDPCLGARGNPGRNIVLEDGDKYTSIFNATKSDYGLRRGYKPGRPWKPASTMR